MDIISIIHSHIFVNVFGILGNVISFMVYLAPLPTFIKIYKKKGTEGFHSLPYLVALFSSMLWLYYGIHKNAIFLISINAFGCVIETIYCIIYIIYAHNDARKLTIKLFGMMNVVAFTLIFLIIEFAIRHHDHQIKVKILGWICVTMSVSVFAAPLSIVVKVVKTRSVQFMPFYLSLFLTFSAVIWFVYGLSKSDVCILIPNVVGFILGVTQMMLYGYYSKYGDCVVEEREASMINIVVVNPLGSCEVFPIPLEDENEDIVDTVINQQLQVKKLGAKDEKEDEIIVAPIEMFQCV